MILARSKRRSIWVENHIKNRKDRAEYNILEDLSEKKFNEYFKISREVFDALHRYLATGVSFRSIGYSYRIGESTISKIVVKVCDALWIRLQPIVLKEPTQAEWKQIAIDFKRVCQFDHCCGAIDGKHVVIQCPPNLGSTYFNYKKTFSIVLLAVCDSQRKFIVVDIESMGRFSDIGILSESEFGEKLISGNIRFPEEPLTEGGINMPYVLVEDEAFPLLKNLMRPYPKERLTASRRIFNYRHAI
ncbi:unnamed protein product [Arctia plantaginis]|uniref:DDE Tnp4 domain-containing protein n=1 Tax=Arctia plantaginis TaxID=874455 RepID=A0A8S0Z944_ARCPL|nr:unnamed protein product [Arctia plantaginis]